MEEQDSGIRRNVGVFEPGPRSARARRAPRRARPLVRADRELRAVAAAWVVVGSACVVAAIAFGSLGELSPLEFWATLFALLIPPLSTLATLLLGKRTSPRMVYRFILDRAPPPPPGIDPEPRRRTAVRAALVAVCLGLGLLPLVAFGLALELAAMGKPREEIPDHLVAAASLVDGVWLLVCAAAAAKVERWIERWEEVRGRAALCPPLHSGLLSHVYYAAGGPPPAFFPGAMPPSAPPSRGTGAGSGRREP